MLNLRIKQNKSYEKVDFINKNKHIK